MSLMATNPSSLRTWSPSLASVQKRHSDDTDDPLLGHGLCARADERPHLRVDEPGRVVVCVATPGPVDEHDVLFTQTRVPATPARLVGGATETRAPLLLDR